jgi:hypothetical protein
VDELHCYCDHIDFRPLRLGQECILQQKAILIQFEVQQFRQVDEHCYYYIKMKSFIIAALFASTQAV